ncbi:MAG: hypothetical protein IJW75_00420 [Alphaproteobacteria bacterium]|nr:hypothetical protein [Alphaproteobacteria bacterium]
MNDKINNRRLELTNKITTKVKIAAGMKVKYTYELTILSPTAAVPSSNATKICSK